jgi:hypothetical protein
MLFTIFDNRAADAHTTRVFHTKHIHSLNANELGIGLAFWQVFQYCVVFACPSRSHTRAHAHDRIHFDSLDTLFCHQVRLQPSLVLAGRCCETVRASQTPYRNERFVNLALNLVRA